jgi:hypothetical protein
VKVSFIKIVSMFIIFAMVFSQLPLGTFAAETSVSRDEYSRTYINSDLSETVEIFPYSLFTQNKDTLGWEQKQNVEVDSGAISYVSETEPLKNFSLSNEVKIGKDTTGQYEAYMKFGNHLPSLNGGLLLGAKLRLYDLMNNNPESCYYCPYYINEQYSIYKILNPWNVQDLTWSNKPELSESPVANKTTAMPVNGAYFIWDVSSLVAEWYKNPGSYYGVAIKAANPQSETSLRTFSKLNSNINLVPVLQIRYSPKPEAPMAVSHGLGPNSSKGYVNLQWYPVTGAKGYRVYMYNGKEFEQVYEGKDTKWSSLGKNLWPTNEQIRNGEVTLRKDGSGTDLSDHPGLVYRKQGDTTKEADKYYFRISAYNDYGETELSEETAVKMPDTTAPTVPENIRVSNELISNFTLTWDPSVDNSKVEYSVKLTTDSGYQVFTGSTDTNSITIPEEYLIPQVSYNFSLMAKDTSGYQSNYSDYSAPVKVTARRKMDAQLISISSFTTVQEAGSSPKVRIVFKNTGVEPWTQAGGYLLKADGIDFSVALAATDVIKTGDVKAFEFKLSADMPLGTTQIRWQMFNQNTGYFGESNTMTVSFEDRIGPQISLFSPIANQTVSGKVLLEGLISDYRLKHYSVSYGYGEAPTEWIKIKDGNAPAVDLGEWETKNLKNGTYKLRIEAEDTSGNKASLDRIIYVNNPVPTPTVHEVTDQSTSVTGTAKPGTNILILRGETRIGSGTVNKDGTFSVAIPVQPAGTYIKIISIEGGNESDAVSVQVKDVTPPKQPRVNIVNNKSTVITGKTEPAALVMVKLPAKTYSGKADALGNFAIAIPIQNSGTTLNVMAKDTAGNISAPRSVTVARVAPNIPAVNEVNNKSSLITGKTEKYAIVTAKIGTKTYSSKADAYGNYKITIPIQNSGVKLYVTAKDTAGNISAARSVTVARVAPNIPVINPVRYYSTAVTGKTERYAVVSVKIGTRVYSAKADYNGNFKVYIPKQRTGTKLAVTAKDAKGLISAARMVTVY